MSHHFYRGQRRLQNCFSKIAGEENKSKSEMGGDLALCKAAARLCCLSLRHRQKKSSTVFITENIRSDHSRPAFPSFSPRSAKPRPSDPLPFLFLLNRHRRSAIRPLFFFLSAGASRYRSGTKDGVHRCRGIFEKGALFPRTIFAAPLAKIPLHGALPLSGIPLYRRVRFSLRRIFSISALFGCLTRLADCSAKRTFVFAADTRQDGAAFALWGCHQAI